VAHREKESSGHWFTRHLPILLFAFLSSCDAAFGLRVGCPKTLAERLAIQRVLTDGKGMPNFVVDVELFGFGVDKGVRDKIRSSTVVV